MALQVNHMMLQVSHMTLQVSHMALQVSHMALQVSHNMPLHSHVPQWNRESEQIPPAVPPGLTTPPPPPPPPPLCVLLHLLLLLCQRLSHRVLGPHQEWRGGRAAVAADQGPHGEGHGEVRHRVQRRKGRPPPHRGAGRTRSADP